MKLSIRAGATSETVDLFIQDSSKTDGSGLTGLAFNTSGLTCYYNFPRGASTAVTLATLSSATAAWSSGGFKEIDSTNQPGVYRFDIPNALLASGNGRYVKIYLRGASNMAPCVLEIELTGWDNQDAVHGGLSALPNAAAGASGGLVINGSNAGTVTLAALTVTGNVSMAAGLNITQSSSNTAGLVVTGNGTGAGAVFTSGSGATGDGVQMKSASTLGNGLTVQGSSGGNGMSCIGGNAGAGWLVQGNSSSAIIIQTTGAGGDGIHIATTVGHGVNIAADGTNKHGLFVTGGTGGTSDGIKAVAGTGGVDIRGNLTGNIHGTLDTLTTYTGDTPQSGDCFARLGAPAGASIAADIAGRLASFTVDGKTPQQALQYIGAMLAGKLPTGAGSGTEAYVGLDGATTRVTMTIDASGNRTAVVYNG